MYACVTCKILEDNLDGGFNGLDTNALIDCNI